MKTSSKLWLAVVIGLIVVVGGLVAVKGGQIGAMINAGKSFSPPPESVTIAKVEAASWQASRAAIGTLVAVRGVTLGSELPGLVRALHFDSGASVRAGAELVKLDTSTEEAQLVAATSDATLAHQTLERAKQLRAAESNSPADLDAAEARARGADATISVLKTTIAKKTIRAPFDGRIGIRMVELGQVVASGTPLASLQSVSPIHAEFWLPQEVLSELEPGLGARLTTGIFPDSHWDGRISLVNPEVDVATRNVRVRATFPNTDARLRPGMFVAVEVLSSDTRPVLLIPNTAVIYAPYGDSVFTVEPKKEEPSALVARQKFVRLGERRGDQVAVASGIIAGETLVSNGAFKLRNGAAVVVKNDAANQPAATPPALSK